MSVYRHILVIVALAAPVGASSSAPPVTPAALLDACAAQLDRLQSWRLGYEFTVEDLSVAGKGTWSIQSCDVRFDGTRVCNRTHLWQGATRAPDPLPKDQATYMSLQWDGRTYTKYRKTGSEDDAGLVMLDDFASADPRTKELEVAALQYHHPAAPLIGYCPWSFERIDTILREAETIAVRPERQSVRDHLCHVMDATTRHGQYTVWIDPARGFSIARLQMRMSKAAGHDPSDMIIAGETFAHSYDVERFDCVDGVWIAVDVTQSTERREDGALHKSRARVKVTRFEPNPDHEALGSFGRDDIPNGTLVIVVPVTHIRYVWQDGELIKHIDEDVVEQIDAVCAGYLAERQGRPIPDALEASRGDRQPVDGPVQGAPEPASSAEPIEAGLRPRPHCGLYCLYAVLQLDGQDVDYRDLVKPEYYGRLNGSSLAELNQAAMDYGLHAGVVARLTTRALRRCPYQAILHVRSDLEAKEYDHYQLFMGTENGRARLFNPPEAPKLVSFAELAHLWDGYALFVSPRPFDVDAIFSADRQRLVLYGTVGVLLVLGAHCARRLWLARVGHVSRSTFLPLTVGQGVVLAGAALVCGIAYHAASADGVLANAKATAALQRAYRGTFIPKIGEQKVRRWLGTDTVFVDARLASDYGQGHLEGAISIPVDANDALWEERTAGIAADVRIVVYCQSAGCKFAERVGIRLLEDGFSDIAIFKGGWMEWVDAGGAQANSEAPGNDEQRHSQT